MYDNTQINFVKCLYLYSNHYFCIQKIIIGMYVGKYLGVSKWRKPFYLNKYLNKYFFLLRRIIIERKYRLMKSSSSFQVWWAFTSHWRKYHLFEDVTMIGEGLQILTYARHSWPLSSQGSLACQTYRDTGHLFILVIS